MKILIVTQYFWPENFRINDLAIALVEKGHHVEVLTGKPNYPGGKFAQGYSFFGRRTESWHKILIHRSPVFPRGSSGGVRLFLNYLSFAFFCSIRALSVSGHFDKILVYQPSPITVGIPAAIVKWRKKSRIYFWVQDLWPQSVTAAGGVNNRIIIGTLNRLTRWIYSKCDKILIQSEAFRRILIAQGVVNDKISYYPNSVEELFTIKQTQDRLLKTLPNGFRIMFAGNIGESQDFETIVEAARIISKKIPDVKWVILGDGRKKTYVKEKIIAHGLHEHLFLLGSFSVETMPDFFACADCLLVSLKRDDIFKLTIPSKIQSYMACGKPILASLDGEGARVIREASAGLIAASENPEALAQCVEEMYCLSKEERYQMGLNGRKYFDANFERKLLLQRLQGILISDDL